MGLLSFFKRQPAIAAPAPDSAEPDAVAAARTRARRRLLGATVLLGLGVIGFPLLFETQPRPIPINLPIEIARKDSAPPLVLPGAVAALSRASAAVVDGLPAAPAEIVERAGEQGRDVAGADPTAAAASAAKAAPKPAAKAVPEPKTAVKPTLPSAVTSATTSATTPSQASASAAAPILPAAGAANPSNDDGARVRALLDGQVPASAPSARVVVQVGAYVDPAKLGDARQRVEKLGFKTYTQVVQTDAGQRTRVRVGPFASRAEADRAAARIKASGLPAAILTL